MTEPLLVRNWDGFWTDEQFTQAVEMWREGHTAREIVARIGKTRSAVIAKMNRLGIKQGQPGTAPILRSVPRVEPPPPPPPIAWPAPDYSSRICACGGPTQPGRGLCAKCINRRNTKPNARANVYVGARVA